MTDFPCYVSPADAYQMVLDATAPLPAVRMPLLEAVGLVLAEDVCADRNYPPFRRAMMDGYAVRLASSGQSVVVAGQQPAGRPSAEQVTAEQCFEIMTGAVCPPGTEAVVQKEQARQEGSRVQLPAAIRLGQHIAEVASECAAGRTVLCRGEGMTPLAIAVLASFGVEQVSAIPSPRMAAIVTGEELVGTSQPPAQGLIRDSNGPMLAALAIQCGIGPPRMLRAGDDHSAIRAALEAAGDVDLVVLSGGVSAGAFDRVPEAILDWGGEIVFRKVVQKPGKPLLFARRGNRPVFGLPGNPLACHFCFCRYVRGAIARLQGRPIGAPEEGRLIASITPDRGRTRFVPAVARRTVWGDWELEPLPGVSSADIFRVHQANAYVELRPGSDDVPAGRCLPFHRISHG